MLLGLQLCNYLPYCKKLLLTEATCKRIALCSSSFCRKAASIGIYPLLSLHHIFTLSHEVFWGCKCRRWEWQKGAFRQTQCWTTVSMKSDIPRCFEFAGAKVWLWWCAQDMKKMRDFKRSSRGASFAVSSREFMRCGFYMVKHLIEAMQHFSNSKHGINISFHKDLFTILKLSFSILSTCTSTKLKYAFTDDSDSQCSVHAKRILNT